MDEPQINAQIIKTPAGDDLVVLPRQDYDALLEALSEAQEELADIAVLDQRLAEIEAERLPPFPSEVNAALFRGDRRLAAIRKWRGLTVAQLAGTSAVAEADIKAFERGERVQSTDEARRLAVALDVHPGWLEP